MANLILLHGALGSPASLQPLAAQLASQHTLYCPAFPGHAGEPATRYHMDDLLRFLEDFIAQKKLDRPLVFGYSMGGYAALALAARRPGLLGAVATLATKFDWTTETAAKEEKMLQPDVLEQKVPAFATALRDRHAPLDWKEVVRGTAALMRALGDAPLLDESACARISDPVLLLLGDRDNMVTLEETRGAFARIRDCRLCVLPGTPHPLEKVPVELLSTNLLHFFS